MGMRFKKVAYGTNYLVIALLLAGILAVINAYSYRHFFRIDLTENKKFTISNSTKKILAGLDDIVNIKVYLSKKLPPYLVTLTDEIKDTLTEYGIYSDGNIDVEYIDPADDFSMRQKLKFMGIPLLRLNIIEKDKAAVTDIYMGIAVLYGDNKEIIPSLADLTSLEYELTGKILRITSNEERTIGFLSGPAGPVLQKDLATVNNALQEQYYTRRIDISGGRKIPADVSALVVASPRELSDRDLFEIDQYLMAGGKVIFLIDTVAIENRSMQGTAINSPIGDLLEHYGVKVLPELVLDQLNAEASFQSGPYSIFIPYPFWVRVVRQSIQSDHPIINSLESMVFPWASPLEIIAQKTEDKTVAVLAQTTDFAWTQQDYFDISPSRDLVPPEDRMKQHIMAVAMSGKFESYFADKTIPPVEEKGKKDLQQNTDKKTITPEARTIIKKSPETKIIVVGSSRFVTENFSVRFDGNRTFFLNAIDWFTIGGYLIDIRSREAGVRPLKLVSGEIKTFARIVNMFGVSFLLAIFGLLQFYMRRRRKKLGIKEI